MKTKNRAASRLISSGLVALLAAACGSHETVAPDRTSETIRAGISQAQRVEVPRLIELFGTVEAEKTAAVSARVMAMVTSVHVQSGDVIRKGQALLDIDPQAARGQLAQASGALAQARAALALAERNFERFTALTARNAASELELDMARMQYDQALGAVEQAEGAVAAAASVASDSRVVAPFGGRVTRTLVEVGDLAAPGRPLLLIESDGVRQISLSVPESVMSSAGLALGGVVPIRIDSRPELGTIEARIVEMSPGADPMSHSFLIKAALPEDLAGISSGASGRASVEVDRQATVTVPEAAVLRQGGLDLVVVRDTEGLARSRVVTLGRTMEGGRVEVLSGLDGGESLAVGLSAVPPTGAVLEETRSTEGLES